MRPQTALSAEASILQALAKGVCPICTLLRAYQNSMIEEAHCYSATKLCNFHAWSVAGSSPAIEAVTIFRSMLQVAPNHPGTAVESHVCDWCVALREHEDERLAEFSGKMKHEGFSSWVRQYGTVCLYHGSRLMKVLPNREAEVIRQIVASNQEQLERQLADFGAKLKRGEEGGGGILGHVAEFLVSQRGITR